jgi:hypothetical protein
MKEPPDRWPVRIRAALAFVVVVAALVFIWLLLFVLNSPPAGWD